MRTRHRAGAGGWHGAHSTPPHRTPLARPPPARAGEEECVDAESGARLLPWDTLILDEGHKARCAALRCALRWLGAGSAAW